MEQIHPQTPEQHLVEGQRMAAEQIRLAAETGSQAAVQSYFETTLADTEGATQSAERQAVVGFLAGEQRAAIADTLATAGGAMIDGFAVAHTVASDELSISTRQIGMMNGKIIEQNTATGRAAAAGNIRAAVGANEEVKTTVRVAHPVLMKHAKIIETWTGAITKSGETFTGQVAAGGRHLSALKKGVETTEPDFDGDPADLTRLIDTSVLSTAAQKLASISEQTNEKPDSVLEALTTALSTASEDNSTARLVGQLQDFAQHATQQSQNISKQSTNRTTEFQQTTMRAVSKASDDLLAARRPDDLRSVQAQLTRQLQDRVTELDTLVRRQTPEAFKQLQARTLEVRKPINQHRSSSTA